MGIFRFLNNQWPFKNKTHPIPPYKIERDALLFSNYDLLFQNENEAWPMGFIGFTGLFFPAWSVPENWELCCNHSVGNKEAQCPYIFWKERWVICEFHLSFLRKTS